MDDRHRTRRPHPVRGAAALALVSLAVVAASFAAVVADATPASACSCVGFTDEEAFAQADVVFLGQLREAELPSSGYSGAEATARFDVSAVYAGEAYTEQPVATAQSSASCGLELTMMDGPVLVFAQRVDGGGGLEGQRLEAGLCGGTRPAPEGSIPVGWTASPPVAGTGAAEGGSSAVPLVWVAVGLAVAAAVGTGVVLLVRRRPT